MFLGTAANVIAVIIGTTIGAVAAQIVEVAGDMKQAIIVEATIGRFPDGDHIEIAVNVEAAGNLKIVDISQDQIACRFNIEPVSNAVRALTQVNHNITGNHKVRILGQENVLVSECSGFNPQVTLDGIGRARKKHIAITVLQARKQWVWHS